MVGRYDLPTQWRLILMGQFRATIFLIWTILPSINAFTNGLNNFFRYVPITNWWRPQISYYCLQIIVVPFCRWFFFNQKKKILLSLFFNFFFLSFLSRGISWDRTACQNPGPSLCSRTTKGHLSLCPAGHENPVPLKSLVWRTLALFFKVCSLW